MIKRWYYTGKFRPDFAEPREPGQESVWDYTRPPTMRRDSRSIRVESVLHGPIAITNQALRIAETAAPPTFYVPAEDVTLEKLVRVPGTSFCEWKGTAHYWALASEPAIAIAWDYPEPNDEYAEVKDCLAFYPGRVACFVDQEPVTPQPGEFYGGWVTRELVGPFKGSPGTEDW